MFSSSGGDGTYRLVGTKSNMSIHLDNYFTNRIYTTGSPVSGSVDIQFGKDTSFDKVQILLLGAGKTRMDGVRAPHTISHTFLKLEMPIPESSYPVSRIYEAGQTYTIPFNFVIPSQLTINACNHHVSNPTVHDSHLVLPPSMGPWGGKDDMSPDMSRVDYTIVARVFADEDSNGKVAKLQEASHVIRVLPAQSEQPPLEITAHDCLYKMNKAKTLRKSLLTGKIGKITASAKQPGAVMLSPDGASATGTTAQVDLVFEPSSSQSLPPTVLGISSKVTAITYYSAGAISGFPNMGDWIKAFGVEARGSYPTTTALGAAHINNLRWRQVLKSEARRGSTWSANSVATDGTGATSDGERSGPGSDRNSRRGSKDSTKDVSPVYHTATLQVPIELPVHKKMFIPSFNSCVMSRVYVLWLTVSLSINGNSSSVMLGVPLQVGVQSTGRLQDSQGLPSFETAVEEASAEDHLRPRTLSIPDVQFERHALPGYADLMGGRMVAAN